MSDKPGQLPAFLTRRRLVIALVALVALAFVGGWLGGRAIRFAPRNGIAVDGRQPVRDFALTGHNGQTVSLSDFRGSLVLLYFGYTTCPDVCPNTLAAAHKAIELLGKRGKNVQLLMVSVDPQRDTPAALGEYMNHFDPHFIGLVGNDEQIEVAATRFGIYYEKKASDSALGYLVDHTATLMLIDDKGRLREVFPYGTTAEQLAADLGYLLDYTRL